MGNPPPRSFGGVLGYSLLAALVALCSFLWLPFSLMLPLPLLVAGVLTVVLWQKAGAIPACVLAVGSTVAAALYGLLPALMMLLSQVLPAALILRDMDRQRPFRGQLVRGAAVCLAGMAATVAVTVAMYGRDPIGWALQAMQPIIETELPYLYAMNGPRMAALYRETVTYEEYLAAFRAGLNLMEIYFRQNLLANLITGAAFSGGLAVFWGNWIRAKQGRATSGSFLGLADWRLPDNWVLGLLIMLAAGWLLSAADIRGLDKVNAIVRGLARLSYCTVALAAMDKKGRESGLPVRRRRLRVILMLAAGFLTMGAGMGFGVFDILAVFGAGMAIFGKEGALRPWLDKLLEP